MFCHNCGVKIQEEDLFCQSCGARQDVPELSVQNVEPEEFFVNEHKVNKSEYEKIKEKYGAPVELDFIEIKPKTTTPLTPPTTPAPTQGNYTGSFAIEGKWKNVGGDTHGQMQENSIIIFNGSNCNVWSPQDTYAFYKDGSNYRLDISGLLFATSMSYTVKVIDNDNIEISPGSGSEYSTGNFTVKLKRVG